MKVLTVIVNYRTAELARRALHAAVRASAAVPGPTRLVVVDNDSRDGSFDALCSAARGENCPDRIDIVAAPINGGFGYGNNLAIRSALAGDDPPEYVYLLNPDAFPAENALAKLVAYMDADPTAGIAGSYIHGIDGTPHETAFRFPSILSEFEHAMGLGILRRLLHRYVVPLPIPWQACEVGWVAGASMLLRREMLEQVGLFDEGFFLYFEETDLCLRAKRAGWSTVYVPASKVAHVGSATTGMQIAGRRLPAFWFDSRQRYFVKNHGYATLWLANAAQILGGAVLRVRRWVQGPRRRRPLPERFLRDLIGHMLRTALRPSLRSPGPQS
jgi:hypothetical protein